MATDYKGKFPAADSVALTITIASLAASSTLLAGQQSDLVDNSSNNDLAHMLSGKVRVGTTPAAGGVLELWVYAPIYSVTGTSTYPDTLTGAGNAAKTLTSANVKASMLRRAWSTVVDSTSDRDYFIPQTNIAQLFGGHMPERWAAFFTQSTGVAMNSTGANHVLHYHRRQRQGV